jgi:dipeptidyl aminopeptidase/acylaminoacyl peptidase
VTTIDSVAEDTHIRVIPSAGGNGRDVNASLDRRSSSPQWSADGKAIYYLAADHGKVLIYSVPAKGGASRPLFDKKAQVTAFSASESQFVYIMSDPIHPAEIYSRETPLTHLNPFGDTRLSAPEDISYQSFDGTKVEGWLYPALNAGERVPMILSIHGGPHGQFGYAFSAPTQLNAARGYATLTINPRGSSGYGQKFADGTIGDWGGGDYKDLMAGIDYVLAHHPEIDPGRLGVTGSSYGGYMTNWIVTQTNRFKSAVAVSSLSNLISFYATSLYQDLIHAEFGGFPWDDHHFALLWKESPLAHVANVKTPTLLLHGESDNDVHITQAEEMFTALRQRGVTAEMVRYPREGHGFHEPRHVLDSRVRILEWMDRFLNAHPNGAK